MRMRTVVMSSFTPTLGQRSIWTIQPSCFQFYSWSGRSGFLFCCYNNGYFQWFLFSRSPFALYFQNVRLFSLPSAILNQLQHNLWENDCCTSRWHFSIDRNKVSTFFWQSSSLLWCPVFKSASSSWTFHIIALSGRLFPPCVISVGSLARFIPHICQLWGTTAVFCPV